MENSTTYFNIKQRKVVHLLIATFLAASVMFLLTIPYSVHAEEPAEKEEISSPTKTSSNKVIEKAPTINEEEPNLEEEYHTEAVDSEDIDTKTENEQVDAEHNDTYTEKKEVDSNKDEQEETIEDSEKADNEVSDENLDESDEEEAQEKEVSSDEEDNATEDEEDTQADSDKDNDKTEE